MWGERRGGPRVCRGFVTGVPVSAREWRDGAGASREGHVGAPGPSRKSHGVTKSVRTPRFRPCCPTVTDAGGGVLVAPSKSPPAIPALHPGPGKGFWGPESVTFPASSSTNRARCGFSRTELRRRSDLARRRGGSMSFVTHRVTKGHGPPSPEAPEVSRKSDFRTDLCRMFHEPPTSWASHGGHSLRGPP
jgi:hypothetical protein